MTAELRWILLLLHFTAAAAGLNPSSVTVRDGAGVTLPCFTGTGDQRRCDDTDWIFSASVSRAAVKLFEYGKFHAAVSSKSDRLRVTENCSLVIEKVSADDAGLYTCRQFDSSGRQGEDAVVFLSVVSMTEHKVGDDEVTLNCSVRSYDAGRCEHSVQWLFDDEDKNKETSQFPCSDSVKIQTSEFNQKMKSLRCKVTDRHGNKKLFEFKTQRSTGGDTRPTTTTTATTTTTMMTSEGTNNNKSTDTQGAWWVYPLVGVASVFLVVVIVWFFIRQKKKKTPEIEPETHQNQADPEDAAYVSVSFTKTTRTRDQVKGHDDEVTAAIYSTVKAPPPSSSSDHHDFFATINKLKRRRMVQ